MLQAAYDAAFKGALAVTERDVVPDAIVRRGIRYLLSQRVEEVRLGSVAHTATFGVHQGTADAAALRWQRLAKFRSSLWSPADVGASA